MCKAADDAIMIVSSSGNNTQPRYSSFTTLLFTPAHRNCKSTQSSVYSLIFMLAVAGTCMLSGTVASMCKFVRWTSLNGLFLPVSSCMQQLFSCLQGDNAIEPTTANYTYKHILEVQNTVYEIGLGPSQLKEVRAWHKCTHAALCTGV